MKNLTLIMLLAMVPFLTMAQKRSKKDKEIEEKLWNELLILNNPYSKN